MRQRWLFSAEVVRIVGVAAIFLFSRGAANWERHTEASMLRLVAPLNVCYFAYSNCLLTNYTKRLVIFMRW